MSELTDNKIKEWHDKFCYKEWYNNDLPNGFEWKIRDTVMNDDIEQWLTQAFDEIKEDTAQEAYLQCLAVECGEGECAEAIRTKFKLKGEKTK